MSNVPRVTPEEKREAMEVRANVGAYEEATRRRELYQPGPDTNIIVRHTGGKYYVDDREFANKSDALDAADAAMHRKYENFEPHGDILVEEGSAIAEGNPADEIAAALVEVEQASAIVAQDAIAVGDEQLAEEVIEDSQEHIAAAAEETAAAAEVVEEASADVQEQAAQQATGENAEEAAAIIEVEASVEAATEAAEQTAEVAEAEAEANADEAPIPAHWLRRPLLKSRR